MFFSTYKLYWGRLEAIFEKQKIKRVISAILNKGKNGKNVKWRGETRAPPTHPPTPPGL